MKVSKVGSATSTSGARRPGKAGGADPAGFKQALAETAEAPGGVQGPDGTSAINAVDSLLMVQESDAIGEREARRRMIRRGEEILDRLEEVRRGLLTGTLSREQLTALAGSVRQRRENCADPRLGALMDEIELRAEVELAKLSR